MSLLTLRLLIILFLISAALINYGQDNTPKYSNEFLSLGVGARGLAMNGAQVAVTADISSGYWNPAGLLQISSDQQLMLMHSVYYSGIGNYDFAAFGIELEDSSRLALSLIRFSIDDIPDTRFLFDANGAINYNNIRFFSASDYAGFLSYAKRIKKLGGIDLGGNLKVVHRLVGDFSKAWGFGLDVGLHKSLGNFKLGLTGRDIFGTFNAWSHNADEFREVFIQTGNEVPVSTLEITLPQWTLGAAYQLSLPADFTAVITTDLRATFDGKRNTLIQSDMISMDPYGAIEVGFRDLYFIRYGVGQFQRVENLNNIENWQLRMTGGVGIVLKDFTIDYALTDFGTSAVGLMSHVFSIKINFYDKAD